MLIEANVSAVQLATNTTPPKSAAATPTGGAALAEAVERQALPLASYCSLLTTAPGAEASY